MNILIISYWFPPVNVIGSYRPYHWAKYLEKQGYNITVLTAKKSRLDGNLDFQIDFTKNIKIIEIDFRKETLNNKKLKNNNLIKSSDSRGFLRKVKKYIGPLADQRIGWYFNAKRFIKKEFKKNDYDYMISSFDPPSSIFIARYIAKKYQLKWVSDYRDLWSGNHINKPVFPFSLLQKIIEKKIIFPYVNAATTVSKPLEKILKEDYKGKTLTIENGYDLDDYNNIKLSKKIDINKINITYAGSLYQGYRDPTCFIKALKGLEDKLVFNIFGVNENGVDFIKNETPLNCVKLHGYVSRKEVMAAIKTSDYAVIIENPKPESAGVLTGKIFELLALQKPILSIGLHNNSELYKLLTNSGLLVANILTEQDALYFIEKLVGDQLEKTLPNEKFISQYNRKNQVINLIELLLSL